MKVTEFKPHGMESEENSERVSGHLIETPCGYFDSSGMQQMLVEKSLLWLNTPFVAHGGVMGGGVDCVNLVARIYISCGFMKQFKPPAYVMDGGKHSTTSQVRQWIEDSGIFFQVDKPQTGDVICFNWRGLSEHHVGLMLYRTQFLHVLEKRTVQIADIKDRTYSKTMGAIYRPMAT